MIPSVYIHIGRIVSVSHSWKPKKENKIYFVQTPKLPLRFFVTTEVIKEGSFVFYASTKSSYKSFFIKRMEDVDILEEKNSYWHWNADSLIFQGNFCVIKYKESDYDTDRAFDCRLHFRDDYDFIDIEDTHFQVLQRSFLTTEETDLIIYEAIKRKSSVSPKMSFDDLKVTIADIRRKEKEVEEYVNSLDIESIVNSYVIKERHIYITRVGKDDIVKDYLESEFKCRDHFLNKLLPDYSYTMDDYSWDTALKYKQLADKKAIEYRQKAKDNYDKKKHIDFLIDYWLVERLFAFEKAYDNSYAIYIETKVVSAWGNMPNMIYINTKHSFSMLPSITRELNEKEAEEYCIKRNNDSGFMQ